MSIAVSNKLVPNFPLPGLCGWFPKFGIEGGRSEGLWALLVCGDFWNAWPTLPERAGNKENCKCVRNRCTNFRSMTTAQPRGLGRLMKAVLNPAQTSSWRFHSTTLEVAFKGSYLNFFMIQRGLCICSISFIRMARYFCSPTGKICQCFVCFPSDLWFSKAQNSA